LFYSLSPLAVVVGSMLAAPVSGQANGAEEAFRVWTDASGQHKSEAQLLNVKDGVVRLKKRLTTLIEACRNPTNEFALFETRIKNAARFLRVGYQRIICGTDPETRNYYIREGSISSGNKNMAVFSPAGQMLWHGPISTDYMTLQPHLEGRAGILYGRSVAWIVFPEKFEPLADARPDRVPMDLAEGIDGSDGDFEVDEIEQLEDSRDGPRRGPARDD
jgi:hypothetical protein